GAAAAEAAQRRAVRAEDLHELLVGVQDVGVATGVGGQAADGAEPAAALAAQAERAGEATVVEPLDPAGEVVADEDVAARRDGHRLGQPDDAGGVAEAG